MFPTKRAVVLFALSIPLALLLFALRQQWWFASLYYPAAILALMVADVSLIASGRDAAIGIDAPPLIPVGGRGTVAVTVEFENRERPFDVVALVELEGAVEPPPPMTGAVRNGRAFYAVPIVAARRGRIAVRAVWLRWSGPFGLIEVRGRHPAKAGIEVIPDVRGVREEALLFHDRSAMHGAKPQLSRGEGSEFDKLVDYERGMDARFIDWKRSARHRKLLSREFRQERNHHVILAFDTGHLMLEPVGGVPRLDHAVRAGMVLGRASLRHGDLVGGCGFDARFRSFIQPGRGMSYFSRLQLFAAGLEYRTEETNYALGLVELSARLRRRALVVLFSDFVDSISAELLIENLRLMTRRHVIVFVTARDAMLTRIRDGMPGAFDDIAQSVIAGDFLRERAVVLERIARVGAHCLEVPARDFSAALLNRYLLIKQRGLL